MFVNSVFALEGGVCAGKSTTSKKIQVLGYAHRGPEYMDLISQAKYRALLRKNHTDRLRYFLKIDESRREHQIDDKNFVLDRCFYTLYSFEYAVARMNGTPVLAGIVDELSNFNIIVPTKIVFMDISDAERSSRLAIRGEIDGPFQHAEFNRYNKEFFEQLSNRTDVAFIDCNSLTRNEVISKVLSEFKPSRPQTVSEAAENLRAILG